LVLEWVPKGSLQNLLDSDAIDLSWDDPLLRLATDVARGMCYLHNREYFDETEGVNKQCVLHRDLKPDNALVTDYIAVKITDFGTSRAKGVEDVTMTSVGTPLFAAPEVMHGDYYDEKVDVYSYGLTLLNMMVPGDLLSFIGERWRLFYKKKRAGNPMRLIGSMTQDGWRPVTEDNPVKGAPITINNLVVRCCAQDPTARPSFEEILKHLSGVCKEEIEGAFFPRQQEGHAWIGLRRDESLGLPDISDTKTFISSMPHDKMEPASVESLRLSDDTNSGNVGSNAVCGSKKAEIISVMRPSTSSAIQGSSLGFEGLSAHI